MRSLHRTLALRRACGGLTAVAMVLVTALAACGGSTDSTDETTLPTETEATTVESSLVVEPSEGTGGASTSIAQQETSTSAGETTTTTEGTTTTSEAPSETSPPPDATDTTADTNPTTDGTAP